MSKSIKELIDESTGLRGAWRRWWGYPVWTLDGDGEVRKSRMRPVGDGIFAVRAIIGWRLAKGDGTIPDGYMKKWWPR